MIPVSSKDFEDLFSATPEEIAQVALARAFQAGYDAAIRASRRANLDPAARRRILTVLNQNRPV